MTENVPLSEVWRNAVDANIRYYTTLGQLTARILNVLFTTVTELRPDLQMGSSSPQPPAVPKSPPALTSQGAPSSALVLEGRAGGIALGVFLVENGLPHKVSTSVVASAFADPEGRLVRPALRFEPDRIFLEPGEQVIVRVTTVIDESLRPEMRYQGEISVPGMPGTRIPIVLRRQAGTALVTGPQAKATGPVSAPLVRRKRRSRQRVLSPRRKQKL
ncbi:MAG: hypothetical protein LAO31_19545 [Acidobacteriia bacterium]|nr:hypothetical protein [Terriglobia bacterium]